MEAGASEFCVFCVPRSGFSVFSGEKSREGFAMTS